MRTPVFIKILVVHFVWLLSLNSISPAFSQSQDLHPKTKARIEKYGAEADAITQECDKKVLEAGKKLVNKLNLQLKVLTRERRLAESTTVQQLRDQLTNCTKGAMFESMLERNQVPPSAGLHHQFGEFMEEAAKINRDAGKKLTKLRDDFLKDLERLPGKDSIPVRKFREQVISLVNPDSDGGLPDLPDDPQDAERIRYRSQLETKMRYEKRWKREIVILLGKLQPILDKAIEEERLSEANAIQELVKMLTSNPDPNAIGGFLRSERSRLPTDAADLLEKFAKWNESEKVSSADQNRELDKSAVPQVLADLKQTLRTSDTSTFDIKGKIQLYYNLKGERPDWLMNFQLSNPKPRGDARLILEEFDRATSKRRLEADQKDAENRKQLLDALSLLNPKGPAAIELKSIQDLLTADYAEGLRGVLLLEQPKELDGSTQKRIMGYRKEGLIQLQKLRETHSAAKNATREKLTPIRNALIDQEDFRELVALDTAFTQRKHAFPPIWIPVVQHKMFSNDFSSANWMELLDVGEKGYMLNFTTMGVIENWFPRDQLALSPSELKTTQWLFRDHNVDIQFTVDKSPTPIDSQVRLKVGSKVLGFQTFKWKEITIDDLSPFGVVTYLDDAHTRVQVYPRTAIALP